MVNTVLRWALLLSIRTSVVLLSQDLKQCEVPLQESVTALAVWRSDIVTAGTAFLVGHNNAGQTLFLTAAHNFLCVDGKSCQPENLDTITGISIQSPGGAPILGVPGSWNFPEKIMGLRQDPDSFDRSADLALFAVNERVSGLKPLRVSTRIPPVLGPLHIYGLNAASPEL
jgi:hypothetical protein